MRDSAAVERCLAPEDPKLDALLAGSASVRRPRILVRIGWAMVWVGAVLLFGGSALSDPWLITWGSSHPGALLGAMVVRPHHPADLGTPLSH
jgi:hypothetical protein